MLKFEWDENNNRINRRKHGIWFEEAQSCFDDPNGRLFLDPETAEERFLLIAFSSATRLLIVVHCYKDSPSLVRIISARKTTKHERKQYEERV
jgi:uncharacterized DUF497 family protein